MLLSLKQYEKAVEYFDKYLSLNPKEVKVITLKAKALAIFDSNFDLLEQDKINEAIASCNEALQIDIKKAVAHNIMGNALKLMLFFF